jgi:hypothetical protein
VSFATTAPAADDGDDGAPLLVKPVAVVMHGEVFFFLVFFQTKSDLPPFYLLPTSFLPPSYLLPLSFSLSFSPPTPLPPLPPLPPKKEREIR